MILGVSQQVAVSQRINSGLWLPNQAAGWREADVAGVRRAFLLIANWKADKDKNGEIANLPLSTSLVQNGKSLQHRTSLDSGCPFRVALEANVIDFQVGMLRKMGMLDEPELRIETPSMLEARGAHCTVEELYILPASAWSALFEQNGMPKSIWSRVIVPTIVLRRGAYSQAC